MNSRFIWALWTILTITGLSTDVRAQDNLDKKDSKSAQLSLAARKLTEKKYLLRYQFKPGDVIYWQTEQIDTGEVSLQKKKELTRSRTLSTKKWRIKEVDLKGNFTAVQSLVDIDLWQQIDNHLPLSYNSRTDAKPPVKFEDVADTVGIELVNFVFKPSGEILSKRANYREVDLGVGGLIVSFPENEIRVGSQWFTQSSVNIPRPSGLVKRVKIRKVYKLLDVQNEVARISVNTQVLTPIHAAEVEVQLMHQLTAGELQFDIRKGRLISREFKWDSAVHGFSTADSLKKYVGRFKETEKSVREVESLIQSTVSGKIRIRTMNEPPIFRQ